MESNRFLCSVIQCLCDVAVVSCHDFNKLFHISMTMDFFGSASASVLAIIGLIYVVKTTFSLLLDLSDGFRAYILPRIVKSDNYVSRYGKWAVVTGCTQGIGKSYVKQLAKRGMDVVLVSRSEEKLEAVAQEIRSTYAVETMVIVADFTDAGIIQTVVDKIKKSEIDVGVLVNNVGMDGGHMMPFLELSEQSIRNIIIVNCLAGTMLCRALLPNMKKKGKGNIKALRYLFNKTINIKTNVNYWIRYGHG